MQVGQIGRLGELDRPPAGDGSPAAAGEQRRPVIGIWHRWRRQFATAASEVRGCAWWHAFEGRVRPLSTGCRTGLGENLNCVNIDS